MNRNNGGIHMKKNKQQKQIVSKILNCIISNDEAGLRTIFDSGIDINFRDGEERTPLMNAVIENKTHMVKDLINVGADINAQDSTGATALHFAAQSYYVDMVKVLLENKAQVDVGDANGNTPLSDAVFYSNGRGEIISLLLQYGADRKLENNYGISPLELSRTIDNYDILKFFES
jgi:uncharacterized protein